MSDAEQSSNAQGCWILLRAGGKPETGAGIPTMPSGMSGANGPARFALGVNGEARILLPLGPGEDPRLFRGALSLSVEVCSLTIAGRGPTRFLDVTCRVPELEGVFARVADHIVARIANGASSIEAASATMEEFRRLLSQPPGSEISTSRIAGLVGELLVLKRLLDRSPDGWQSWTGPTGGRHDFSHGTTGLEVKVSLGRGRTRVTVNGLEQLAEPVAGRLFLLHLQLEATSGGLLSVAGLGRAVLATAGDPYRVADLLAGAGCADVDDDAWNRTAFRLENETLYEVGPAFPRLISAMLPPGVAAGITDVNYTIDLAFATDSQLDRTRIDEVEAFLVP